MFFVKLSTSRATKVALWTRLMVNSHPIGTIEIQRLAGGPKPDEDSVFSYRVRIRHDGHLTQHEIEHRYGDGALVLLRKALEVNE